MEAKLGNRESTQLRKGGIRERAQALAARMLERERWPRERLRGYQQSRLRETVQHAIANSPYYRDALGEVGTGDIDVRRLPPLTKNTLTAEFDRIITDRRVRLTDLEQHLASEHAANLLFGEYRIAGTGGTTGKRSIAVYDQAAWDVVAATHLRAMAVQEVTAETRSLSIGAPTPVHLGNRLFAELRTADAPRLAVTTPLPEVVLALNAYQPEAILTYPSFIRELAEEQSTGRLRIAPRKLCSVAETLTQDVRDLARETWGATVLNGYGATEIGILGQECPWTTGVHVFEDLVILEVVDENDQPVSPGVAGHKVLVTNLFNRTLPLIRYELSDLVKVTDGPCPCGRSYLRLASIQGRREEVLSLPGRNGRPVRMHALQLHERLLRIPEIRRFQVSPRPAGLVVRVVLRDTAQADDVLHRARQAIEAELDQVGAVVETLTVEAIEQLGRTGTGAKETLVSLSD